MNFIKNELKVIKERVNSSTLFGMSLNNALGSLTVRVVSVLLVFLTNVALARTIGTTEYGTFVYATSWLNIFLVIAMFGFDKLMVRQVAIYQSHQDWGRLLGIYRYAKKRTFSSSIFFALIICIIVYLVSLTTQSRQLLSIFYWVALVLPIGVALRLQQVTLQGLNFIALGQLPEYVIQYLVLLLLVFFTEFFFHHVGNASFVMFLYMLAGVISLFAGWRLLSRSLPAGIYDVKPNLDRRDWIQSLIPLMLVGFIFILNDQIATCFALLNKPRRIVAI